MRERADKKERKKHRSFSSRSIRMLLDLASYFVGCDLYFLFQRVFCLYPHSPLANRRSAGERFKRLQLRPSLCTSLL